MFNIALQVSLSSGKNSQVSIYQAVHVALILVTFQQRTTVIQALQTSLILLFPLLLLQIAKYMELQALLVAN